MRREYLNGTSGTGGDLPDIPFAEDCIFYAPLTQGDLTDHISGVTGVIASGSTINWDSAKGMYLIHTEGTSTSYAGGLRWEGLSNLQSLANGCTLVMYGCEEDTVLRGNSYSVMMGTPILTSSNSSQLIYMCNYRFTNKGGGGGNTVIPVKLITPSFFCTTVTESGDISWYQNATLKKSGAGWINGGGPSLSIVQLHSNNTIYGMYVSDIRVYKRALSVSELAQL